jgi:autotransporter-associated beta strand protein
MASLFAGLMAFAAQAVTYTWDGGSTVDSNWGSAENWNPDGAPLSASDTWVQFNGNTRPTPSQNIATPFVLNRLDFLGGATYTAVINVGGTQLQFVTNGVTQPRVYLQRNQSCTISTPIDIPAGTTLYAEIGTYGVTLGGAITGGGAIDKLSNAGGLTLSSSANTFSGGLTIRAQDNDWYKANINASNAMGAGPVSLYGGTLAITRASPGGLSFYGTTTHTNAISLFQNSPIFADMPNGYSVVTLNGTIDLNTFTLHLRGGGAGTVGGVISEGGASAITKSDAGTWTLNNANTFAGKVTLVNGTLKLGAAGSLNPLAGVSFACATGFASVAHATFDLNGRSQQFSQLEGATAQPWLTNILTSATAATLTVDQSANTVFNGRLAGALSLVKAGAGSLTLSNYPSATTGGITVSNGTLAVASGASLGGSMNVAVAGGALDLRAAAAIADAATLSIADGAKVSLGAGLTETVDKLFLNGVQQPRGTYGTAASGAMYPDDAHFIGTGMLNVFSNPTITPVDSTWDAEGADTLLSTEANWVGDAVPAFDGASRPIFATGGITATVDTAVNLYGMTFNRDGAFTLAAGAGVVSNGAGGISAAAPNTTSRTYTLAEDVLLTDNQTWAVTTNWPGATTLNVTGTLDDGLLPCNITKTEFGPLSLRAANTFDGTLTVNAGDVGIYHAQALGSTNGNTVINGGAGGRLYLYGNLTVEEPLVLNGERNNGGTLIVGSGSNVLTGPITCYNQVRVQAYNGPLVITGGVTADNNGLFVVNSGSTITFSGKPLSLGTRTFWSDSGGIAVLAVAGNTWGDTLCAGGGIRCEAPNALPAATSLQMGVGYSPSCTLNLNGNDQTIGRLFIGTPNPGTRTITSAAPAWLTVNQSADTLSDARFTGAVSLLKLGGGNLTLTNAATSTTGSFIVSNGTLTVARDGTFGANSTNIVVGGSGTLTLSNSVAIADSATLSIASGGTAKVSLAADVNETVGWLYLGGKLQRVGTYGSTDSEAAVKNGTYFSGSGVLTVLHDKSGTMIKVR